MDINLDLYKKQKEAVEKQRREAINSWKSRVLALNMTITAFCIKAGVFQPQFYRWTTTTALPNDANFEKVESTLKSLEKGE